MSLNYFNLTDNFFRYNHLINKSELKGIYKNIIKGIEMSLEQFLANITLEELEELKRLKEQQNSKPTYSFSKINDSILESCVDIIREFDKTRFNEWFSFNYKVSNDDISFLENLIELYGDFLESYKEETLKAHFVIPILNRVNFLLREYRCSGLYEETIIYERDEFIFKGTTDFTVSKGLNRSEKPYFFIQEFKKGEEFSNPRPQLIAELIAGIEINNWQTIKGAYIVGAIWNFVILEKLGEDRYQYFVSQNFDSTKTEDLKGIYRNLMFIKNEIIEMIKEEK